MKFSLCFHESDLKKIIEKNIVDLQIDGDTRSFFHLSTFTRFFTFFLYSYEHCSDEI